MQDPVKNTRDSSRTLWLLGGLAALSVILRCYHLDWGAPDIEEEAYPLKKAFEMCGWGSGQFTLNPETAGWPSLSFYVHMLIQHLHYGLGRISGAYGDRLDYYLIQLDWSQLLTWARGVGVLAGGGVVFLGARLADKLAGRGAALLVGLVLVFSPFLTQQSRLITPDILLAVFAAAAVTQIVTIFQRGRLRDYVWAGVWIGLGASSKYTPVLLAPILFYAHWQHLRAAGGPVKIWGLKDRRLWLAALACVMVFAITSPFVVFNPDVLQRDLDYQTAHLQDGHFGSEGRHGGYLYYLVGVLGPGLGWPALVLALAGLVWSAWKKRGVWLLLLLSFLVFYGVLGGLGTTFDRYMLPALLPLCLGLAGFYLMLRELNPALTSRHGLWVIVALGLLLTIQPALGSLDLLRQQARPGTLQQARDFMLSQLPNDAALAMELYTPALPKQSQLDLRQQDPALANMSQDQQTRYLDLVPRSVTYLPFYTTRRGASDFYYDLRHFMPFDYIVTSSAVRSRYEQSPQLYPRQVAFYADLEQYGVSVKTFSPDPNTRGPEIRIYRIADQTRQAVAQSKPALTEGFEQPFSQALVGSHFQDFIQAAAQNAMAKQYVSLAALYYQPLYATTPTAQRGGLLPAYALAHLQLSNWTKAAHLLTELLQLTPNDAQATGYLGLAQAQLGQSELALIHYRRCLELARTAPVDQSMAHWAEARIAEMAP